MRDWVEFSQSKSRRPQQIVVWILCGYMMCVRVLKLNYNFEYTIMPKPDHHCWVDGWFTYAGSGVFNCFKFQLKVFLLLL